MPDAPPPTVEERPSARSSSLRPAVAVLLVVLGIGLLVLWRVASGSEQHSWDRGAVPPAFVRLTAGHSYAVSIPGGVGAEPAHGVSPDTLACAVSGSGIGSQQLRLSAEQDDTKATQQIASFVSPATGQVQISCSRLPRVFVDDADDAGFDYAGVLIWLAALALAVGLPLGLSVLRDAARTSSSTASARSGEDDQVE